MALVVFVFNVYFESFYKGCCGWLCTLTMWGLPLMFATCTSLLSQTSPPQLSLPSITVFSHCVLPNTLHEKIFILKSFLVEEG